MADTGSLKDFAASSRAGGTDVVTDTKETARVLERKHDVWVAVVVAHAFHWGLITVAIALMINYMFHSATLATSLLSTLRPHLEAIAWYIWVSGGALIFYSMASGAHLQWNEHTRATPYHAGSLGSSLLSTAGLTACMFIAWLYIRVASNSILTSESNEYAPLIVMGPFICAMLFSPPSKAAVLGWITSHRSA